MAEIISIPGFNDPFSSISHLLGAVIFALLSIFLLRRGRGDRARMISLAVFCIAGHEIFHVAVLIGLGFHWAFIYQIADGQSSARNGTRRKTACPTLVES